MLDGYSTVKLTDAQLPRRLRKTVWGNNFGRCTDLAADAKISPRDCRSIFKGIDNFVEGCEASASSVFDTRQVTHSGSQ